MHEIRDRRLVLFADDEQILHDLMSAVLHTHGYDVECLGDGEAALDAFRKRRHDALVVDLMMPRMNGFEFLRELNAIDPAVSRRTIVLTGASRDTWEWFDRDSVAAFLLKPVDVKQLLDELRKCGARGEA